MSRSKPKLKIPAHVFAFTIVSIPGVVYGKFQYIIYIVYKNLCCFSYFLCLLNNNNNYY